MADVSVRPARPEDADAVARVQRTTWQVAYADLLPPEVFDVPVEDVAAAWRRSIELPPSPAHLVLVALDGEQLVGFAAVAPDEEEPNAGELSALLVEPRWGRRGHGSRLLAAAVDAWRTWGFVLGTAWVWERDGVTRSFLTSAGWDLAGAVRGLDTGPRVERQLQLHTALD